MLYSGEARLCKRAEKGGIMKQIQQDIKEKSFHSTYLLYGEEEYLVRLYRDKLKNAILGDDEMNYSYFYGKDVDLSEVRAMVQTLPFFQEHRVILLEDTKLFKTANDFSDCLLNMPETTIIIFVEKEVDKRNKLFKYVTKSGYVAEMKPMSERETKSFVVMELGRAGKKIRESTLHYFLEQVDNSMINLQNEVHKLAAYAMEREEITIEDINSVCVVQITGQIFKMLDAVANRNKVETITLYHDLLELRENAMSILYLLTRHFNLLLQAKLLGNLPKAELAKKLGVPPFSVGKYQMQCRHFSLEQLKEMFTACVDTEYDFKRGKIQDQIGVELLLVQFLQY